MLIHCPYCEAKVDGTSIGELVENSDPSEPPYRITLLKCPGCSNALVGMQMEYATHDGYEWDNAARVWPQPDRGNNWELPTVVRVSLDEAAKCFRAGAYSACAVMCGRALEGVCVDKKTASKMLAKGLEELLNTKVIDDRLFAWGEQLRKMRNLGAHASDERVVREDARDLLDFLYAICDYVYLLNRKFDDFMRRQAAKKPATAAPSANGQMTVSVSGS